MRRSYKTELEELTEKIKQYLIDQTGEDFVCEECGTECSVYDTSCSYCEAETTWSTDCQIKEVLEAFEFLGID